MDQIDAPSPRFSNQPSVLTNKYMMLFSKYIQQKHQPDSEILCLKSVKIHVNCNEDLLYI